MIRILHLETSTKQCSVTLSENKTIIATEEVSKANYSHAEKLHTFIEDVLSKASFSIKELDAISVGKGPGSYTGLRIGVSAAKGLSYGLNIPLIALNSLEILSRVVVPNKGDLILPVFDARRMEVYYSVLNSNFEIIEPTSTKIIDSNSFSGLAKENNLIFIGDGAAKIRQELGASFATFIDVLYPSSKQMVEMALLKFISEEFEDVAYFEPFYLKDFKIG